MLLLAACEDNELEINGLSPLVEAKFINNDTLASLNDSLTKIGQAINNIDARVIAIDTLIEDGDAEALTAERDSLLAEKALLTEKRTDVNQLKSVVESGKLQINRIFGDGGNGNILPSDSMTRYNLPLNINDSNSKIFIVIRDSIFWVSFDYTRDTVYEEGVIVVKANNVKLNSRSDNLDSVSFPCDTLNCNSSEAKATIYFKY